MTMVGSIGGGWFPSYFISRGFSPYDGRIESYAHHRLHSARSFVGATSRLS